jgi:hypothetical protein
VVRIQQAIEKHAKRREAQDEQQRDHGLDIAVKRQLTHL